MKKWFSLFVLFWLFLLNTNPAFAQTYRFQLKREVVNVYITSNGTLDLEYILDFVNDANADPIDFVDIGLPNENYDISKIRAEINGQPIKSIERSPYVTYGVALGLGNNAIPPGKTGRVHVVIEGITGVLYEGTEKEAEKYASFQFMPNYFGSEYVYGNTELTLTIFLPPGLQPEEPRYYPPQNWPGPAEPESGFDDQGRVFYRWQSSQANGSTKYTFGAAFPARLVPENAIITKPPFRLNISADDICGAAFCLGFLGFIGLIIYGSIWGEKKRKLQYLPPKVSVAGHGIKRGLTAVEAAIVMEQPMDKILSMILFSTIKKGAATVKTREPLEIDVVDPLPENLQPYEKEFLEAMQEDKAAARRRLLQDMMINLVKSVSEKMRGFSRKETVDYYKNIVERAWQYVEQADTPEVKMQKYDEVMDWTMLDRKHQERTEEVFRGGPIFVPVWWGRYDPTFGRTYGGTPTQAPISLPGGGGGGISLPTLPGSEFAASIARGIENFSSNVVGDLTSFTDRITQTTNPVPKTTYTRSGGGGRSCACACACAGCACACAGGGR